MLTFPAARRGLIVAAVAACTVSLSASTPKFFQSATQADFLKGDIDNLAIDTRGQLMLGPATELVYETASPFLWTVIPGTDGSLFIGTGNDGRVYRVDAQGAGRTFFDATELEIHALAPAPNGGLYVGTSPDGRVYKIDRNGTATPFFDPEEKYIWSLASDATGTLYAGTGEKGTVYRITPEGRSSVFYTARATHATALALDRSGNVIVGTESPGRVFKVDQQGKGFLLLDTPFQEIRTLRFDDRGTLFVAGVSGRPASGSPAIPTTETGGAAGNANPNREPVPTVTVSTEVTAIVSDGGSGSAPTTSRIDARSAKGGVYRVAPDGLWDLLWESRDDLPYDLTFDAERRLVIGTGGKGKIYRLEGTPLQPTLIARAGAQQVTALFSDARGRLYFATSNPGKLFRLSPTRASKGSYESEVRDAQMVSSWGAISWRGTFSGANRVEISTRSGNAEVPDDTWSDWSAPYTASEGSAITSPKARYLQWRAVLTGTGEGPVLTSVNVAYLQRNLRPQVRSVTVHPPGIVFQKPFSTGDPDLAGFETQTTPDRKLVQAAQNSGQGGSALGRRTYQKGLETIQWRAEDENDDELSYDVLYRREGEAAWRTLRESVSDPILVWDTTTVPNGTYFVKVVASDAPSNPAGTALTGDLESAVFEIDNLPPAISGSVVRVDGARTTIAFEVKDEHSLVQKVEFSEDGLAWRTVFSVDGMADSKSERYEIALDRPLGPRGATIRATDAMNNVATAQIEGARR